MKCHENVGDSTIVLQEADGDIEGPGSFRMSLWVYAAGCSNDFILVLMM